MSASLITARLRLVPATPELIAAELAGQGGLATALDAAVPPDWPPEHHDTQTLRFWSEKLSQPGAAGWWLYYALQTERSQMLVASVGYKGPPKEGVVEIGYSVVPSWQRRGLATEACRALIDSAWERGATVVVAHTLEHLVPSLGVLRKLGFEQSESGEVLEFRLTR